MLLNVHHFCCAALLGVVFPQGQPRLMPRSPQLQDRGWHQHREYGFRCGSSAVARRIQLTGNGPRPVHRQAPSASPLAKTHLLPSISRPQISKLTVDNGILIPPDRILPSWLRGTILPRSNPLRSKHAVRKCVICGFVSSHDAASNSACCAVMHDLFICSPDSPIITVHIFT